MNITKIIVHCSDSPQGRGDGAETIHQWHKEFGWSGIGYHDVILEDGTVEAGRPHYWKGAHCRNYNNDSIGVCLIGHGDDVTRRQAVALASYLAKQKKKHPEAAIFGHRELDPRKTCPGFDVIEFCDKNGVNHGR